MSARRISPTAKITAIYVNAQENLKQERFELELSDIDTEGMTLTIGPAVNEIETIQDVLGTGSQALPGDLDFIDAYEYDGADVSLEATDDPQVRQLKVNVLLATLSLKVPYYSQRGPGEEIVTEDDGTTTYFKKAINCMPTTAKMLLDYWSIESQSGGELTRNALMQTAWDTFDDKKRSTVFPRPWQIWHHMRNVMTGFSNSGSVHTFNIVQGPAIAAEAASIPSPYADGIKDELIMGQPVMTSTHATSAGHVMIARGAVVDHEGTAQWLIFNDPNGNLAGADSVYGRLRLSAPVGLRGNLPDTDGMNEPDDVEAVREVLRTLGYYEGPIVGPIDESDLNDPTNAAIKSFQGGGPNADSRVDPNPSGRGTEGAMNQALEVRDSPSYRTVEREKNAFAGPNSERGRHAYYSGETEGYGAGADAGHFSLKTEVLTIFMSRVSELSEDELEARLVPGQ
ncbi:MAG: C39 family peptidase [Gammaproteobacteria bacterium]